MLKKNKSVFIINQKELGSVYKQGLVHNIYLVDKFIIKISKKEFSDFNRIKCFLLEKKSLELLNHRGIPVPKYIEVSNLLINKTKHYYIKESYIVGRQVGWDKLNSISISSINKIYNISHTIMVNGAGPLNHSLNGSYKTWGNYIKKSMNNCKKYLSKVSNTKINPDTFSLLNKNFINLSRSKSFNKNVFLLVDFNPGNMFLDKIGNVMSVIDIDHPMGGDYLFDYASINWNHKNTFEKLQSKHLKLKGEELLAIYYYTLISGLNTIVWRLKHNLPCIKELRKLELFFIMYKKLLGKNSGLL